MARVYPVLLEPLRHFGDAGLEGISGLKGVFCAVISDGEILVKEKQIFALGKEYYKDYLRRAQSGDASTEILCYEIENGTQLLSTAEGIFRVKKLGSLYIKDFEKGMLHVMNNSQ